MSNCVTKIITRVILCGFFSVLNESCICILLFCVFVLVLPAT